MIDKVSIQIVAKHLKIAGVLGGLPHDDPESDDSIRGKTS